MNQVLRYLILAIVLLNGVVAAMQGADSVEKKPYVNVPDTVSPQAQEYLRSLPSPASRPGCPALDDLEGWKRFQQEAEATREPAAKEALAQYAPTVTEATLGGVPVLDVRPKGWTDNGRVLIYVHGGAYIRFSARTGLPSAIVAADAAGLRVISVDYTLAPFSKWQQTTDQVISVFQALVKQGIPLDHIAIYGDSAGGGLAAGAVLKMRDQGLGMPAAVVLWSPWADITNSGDTAVTLKDEEPTYDYEKHLKPGADAYADPKDQKHPYVSPVYADFTNGFPPTLIQGGTKEIFLSHFVRLYQALDAAGIPVKLDLYDGMTHVFQPRLANAPEGKAALTKMKNFLNANLMKGT